MRSPVDSAAAKRALGSPCQATWQRHRAFTPGRTRPPAELELNASEAHAIAEVCRRLDGIPLAIELAAARTIVMSPAEVAAHLDERFRLLTGGRRAAVERHQTLRATIDWSYSVLNPADQAVFECLGVFPASFELEAAQAVGVQEGIAAWDVVDSLTSLVAKSLLTADHGDEGATRYQMLESLRHYARERLEARGTADETRRHHAQYFADFAERFGQGIQSADELTWSRRFQAEFDNLRTASLWGLDSSDESDGELALRVISVGVSTQSGSTGGILPLAAQAADRARRGDPHRYRVMVLLGAAMDDLRSHVRGARADRGRQAPDPGARRVGLGAGLLPGFHRDPGRSTGPRGARSARGCDGPRAGKGHGQPEHHRNRRLRIRAGVVC